MTLTNSTRMGVKDRIIYEECMKELDTMFTRQSKRSFGEYFDNQRDKIVKDMQDKNKQQNVEWMERYEERQKEKRFRNHIIENLKEGVDYLDDIQRNKKKNKA